MQEAGWEDLIYAISFLCTNSVVLIADDNSLALSSSFLSAIQQWDKQKLRIRIISFATHVSDVEMQVKMRLANDYASKIIVCFWSNRIVPLFRLWKEVDSFFLLYWKFYYALRFSLCAFSLSFFIYLFIKIFSLLLIYLH